MNSTDIKEARGESMHAFGSTTDFRKTNAALLIALIVLLVVVLC
jgi:hypothetical protein